MILQSAETIPLKKIRGTVSDQKPLATALSVGATEVSAEGAPPSRPLLAGIARLPAGGRGLKGVPPRLIRGADARPSGLGEARGHLVGRGRLLGPCRRGRQRRSGCTRVGRNPHGRAIIGAGEITRLQGPRTRSPKKTAYPKK